MANLTEYESCELEHLLITFQESANGCPITGRWDDDRQGWVFRVDDYAKDWGIPENEIDLSGMYCSQYTKACCGYSNPRDVCRILRQHGQDAEAG